MTQTTIQTELDRAESALRRAITEAWSLPEDEVVEARLATASLPEAEQVEIIDKAADLVRRVRARADDQTAIEFFMRQYDLSSEEGVLLMCVAEALLRIPDTRTADRLIRDKLGDADWDEHLGDSQSVLVNASTWGLMLTGRMINLGEDTRTNFAGALSRLVGRSGEPAIRLAVRQAMRIMGHQFVMGRTIGEALKRAERKAHRQYRYSFDMLGEAALTEADAQRYFDAYANAIGVLGKRGPWDDLHQAPSISVKLSAIHPRYEAMNRRRARDELAPRLVKLAQLAAENHISLTVDAEEADRLAASLDVIEIVATHPSLEGWQGFGMAVQAYQKRAPAVIDWLADLAGRTRRRLSIRLVKGAYWDYEIKHAQELGLAGYPVFTRKANTDVSYLACVRKLLATDPDWIYPAFATHNAHTIAAVQHLAGKRTFEFQRLHGMGSDLYGEVLGAGKRNLPCRVYAPVGSHEELLPYLVRRLLENGANTSFVNQVLDEELPVDELVADPCRIARESEPKRHPRIPLPADLYGSTRKNSMGINLANDDELTELAEAANRFAAPWQAGPMIPGATGGGDKVTVRNPADQRETVGTWTSASADDVDIAIGNAVQAQEGWDRRPAEKRAEILERAAELYEKNHAELIACCIREAGKSIPASVGEVREAVDFLRYYAAQSRELFGAPREMPGPTGESNHLSLHGRGVYVCISPWNFPLAIFTGQVAAALAAGNAVLAKPAEQSTLVASLAVKLLHQAGVPAEVLQLVPGDGAEVGPPLTSDPRVAGVAFTGSTETARAINRALAARDAPIAALVAETGGQNAMIADSSALAEQLVKDVVASAFDSAGQRCSACRVLYLQEDIADHVIEMLTGAMAELKVGPTRDIATDVGPVIDQDALDMLQKHAAKMDAKARKLAQAELGPDCGNGHFFAPRAYEIGSISELEREVFGPVLHVVRYKASELDQVIEAINGTGYGLTLGIHTRIDDTAEYIASRVRVGNCYVNRNQIGAVVGVQPFGGEGLSGTGPKAGGPHYLPRFATERVLTINTTAAGGNASLLTLGA